MVESVGKVTWHYRVDERNIGGNILRRTELHGETRPGSTLCNTIVVSQPIKIFPTFYGTQRLITAFKSPTLLS